MQRRILTTVAALSVGLMIYAVMVGMIIAKLSSMIHVTVSRMPNAQPSLVANGNLNLFGRSVPLKLVFIVGSIAPSALIVQEVFARIRRHNRERLGFCLDCGNPLGGRRGRCSECGLRYERSTPKAVAPMFGVILPGRRGPR